MSKRLPLSLHRNHYRLAQNFQGDSSDIRPSAQPHSSKMQGSDSQNVTIRKIEVAAYTVPTDLPESDGTLEWNSTTLVLVHASAGGETGLGYTYADQATAALIHKLLAKIVEGRNAMAVRANWGAMVSHTRNLGRPGIVSMAISAVDSALWDLKARLLGLPLVTLLGPVRNGIPIYGSGGFTSYTEKQLAEQLGGWVAAGIPRVKIARKNEDRP